MIRIKSPGRICLFGEHQDYLNYPVIAMAISKYIYLEAKRITETKFIIDLPDINDNLEISLKNKELEYNSNRDYLKSGYNQFLRKGINFFKGYKIRITGDIPFSAGVSSSSALVIAWLYFLNLISNTPLNDFQLAIEGYNTEVKEFGEAGGKMDFFSSVYGGLFYLDSKSLSPKIEKFNINLKGFVLGDSLEKKDTVQDLMRVKNIALDSFNTLKKIFPDFDIFNTKLTEISLFLPSLKKKFQEKIIGNITNRDLTFKAKKLILNNLSLLKNQKPNNSKEIIDFYQKLGNLLNIHHKQLKDNIKISTKKIDNMIFNCLESGALGAKINGSGFGGTMFALAPRNEKNLKKSIEESGGKAYLIKTSNGVKIY